MKKPPVAIIAGLFLLMLILPQSALADSEYSISLSPNAGSCGELIRATANVTAPGTYRVCWNSITPENVVATFAGNRTIEFHIPETTKGTYTVYLTREDYTAVANATFEVCPSVEIDPTEGPEGTVVTLTGYGFAASQDIRVTFKDTVVKTGTASSQGSWTLNYTIPATPAGGYTFGVEFKEGVVWLDLLDKDFKVTPKITVKPSSGTVGQTVEVKGTGFAGNETGIEVTFDGEVRKNDILADKDGSWTTQIIIPPRQSGSYIIDASGTFTRARDVDGVSFTVGAGILVEPGFAYVGDTIAVAGGGFRPGETGIRVTLDGTPEATGITARMDGCWESSFVLPASTAGSHTVSASGDITAAVTANLTTRTRIESLSPVEGAPGDSVTLQGSGFHGSQKLTVKIGGIAAAENLQTQSNGNVVISFRVPKGSTEGQQTLVVTDEGGATASVDFTVTKKTLSTTPLPISPKDSTLRSGKVTFKWQGATGSTGYTYTLEIVDVWSKSGITGSSYTLTDTETVTETLPKGTYQWRVKIVDDYGNESPWSDSIKFTVAPIPTWVWVVVGVVVLIVLMVVAYRETKFKVTE